MSGVFTKLVDGTETAAGFRDWARRYQAHITPNLRDVGIDPDGDDLTDRLNKAMADDPESRAGAVARLWSLLWAAEYEPESPFTGYEIGLAAAVLSVRHLAPDVTYGQEKRAVNRDRAEKAAAAKAEKDAQRREFAGQLVSRRRRERPHDQVKDVVAWVHEAMVKEEGRTGITPLGKTILSELVPPPRSK